MRLAVLGPVILTRDDGRSVPITPRQAREVVTILALEHPRSLSLDALADRLWDVPPPATAKTIQGLLSRLRRALTAAGAQEAAITGGPAGYRLVDIGELDVVEFDRLAQSGRQAMLAGTWTVAVDALARSRALWRGTPELPATAAGYAHRARVDAMCDAVTQQYVEALVQAGHVDTAVAELELLTAQQPLRERLWELRMVALARSGRVAEALRTYVDARNVLVEEAGIEPGNELRRLESEILAGHTPTVSAPAAAKTDGPVAARAASADVVPHVTVRYVEVDNVHIAYSSVGEAECDLVIMNPGALPVDCVLTEPGLAHGIEQLTSFARITWLNHRGIGLSDRCTADQLPSVQDWVRDLIAVLDAIDASAPIVYACEDTAAVALELAAERPHRLAGIVLTNAYARFTRGDGYPYGLDPVLAEQSAAEATTVEPADGAFDLLTVIAPSVADDAAFRAWWDNAGRRGASPQVARALRSRHHNSDLRQLIERVHVPVLHLVNPTAVAHDPGHDRYLETHLPRIETHQLPGPDELWWLDTSGTFVAHVERFTRQRTQEHPQT